MIGGSKLNERLPNLTPHRMLLDISVVPKKKKMKNRYNKHLILLKLSRNPACS